jgi:uncharacterized protein YdhG (YjbR/CyaY superfamily)
MAEDATSESGFTAEEQAAMRQRAAELRAEGRKGAKKADGLQAVLDRIAQMEPQDRALAERVHAVVTATAPRLWPKTWYGMPAYADDDGKVVVFFQEAGEFATRSGSGGRRLSRDTVAGMAEHSRRRPTRGRLDTGDPDAHLCPPPARPRR